MPHDVMNWQQAGLKFPSWIRLKLLTLENSLIIDPIGKLQPVDLAGFRTKANSVRWR